MSYNNSSFSNSNGISFGTNHSVVTAIYTVPSTAGLLSAINLSAGTTSNNLSKITFSNANGVSFGLDASTITATVKTDYQSSNANYLTSQSNQAASASNGSFAFQTIAFSNANNVTFGTSAGSIISASVAAQSVVPGIQSIQVSNTTYTTGNVIFSNANGLSFGSSAGGAITASYTVPTLTNSSMTVSDSATSGTLARIAFTNLNGVTLSLSTGAGGSHTIVGSHNGLTSQSNQNVTAGNGGFAFQTLSFSNVNGFSFGTSAGSAITGSYTVPTQSNQNISLFGLGNTTQNSSTVLNASNLSFNAIGSLTVGFSNGSIQLSAPNAITTARASTDAIGLNTAQTNVTWTVNSSGISLNAAGYAGTGTSMTNASATLNSNGLQLSIAAITNSSWTVSDSATSGTVGRLAFTNLNGVTLSLSTGAAGLHTIVGSHNALTSQSNQNALAANGNFNFQTISFSNANGVSFVTSAGSAIAASVVTSYRASNDAIGLNTAQTNVTWTVNSSGLSLNAAGYAGTGTSATNASVTLNSNGLQISVGSAAASPVNFSAGTTSNNLGSVVFSNSNGVSFGLNGSTITASAAGGGVNIAASNTTFTSGTVVMSNNGGALTISSGAQSVLFSVPQTSSIIGINGISVSTNGSTISISQIYPYLLRKIFPDGNQYMSISAPGNGSASVQYVAMDNYLTATRVDALIGWSAGTSAAANTMAIALSAYAAIYTRNGNTLSSVSSGSTQTTYSYASNSSNYTAINGGIRPVSVPMNVNMTPGEYYIFFNMSTNSSSVGTATTNLGQTLVIHGGAQIQSASNYAEIGSNTNATLGLQFGLGLYSNTLTSVPPALSLSAINQTGTNASRANINIVFRNF